MSGLLDAESTASFPAPVSPTERLRQSVRGTALDELRGALDAQGEALAEREVALDRQERRAQERAVEADEPVPLHFAFAIAIAPDMSISG